MKKISSKPFVALSSIMALGVSVPAVAQSQSANGSITIVQPLTVAKGADMKFGTIIRPTDGSGTVTVPALAGTGRSMTGTGVAALVSGGSASAAKFTVTGEGGQSVFLDIPESFALKATNKPDLTVDTLINEEEIVNGNVLLSGALGASGTKEFFVGGSVTISATTASANYSGVLTVTASYN